MLAWLKWGNGITPEQAGKKGDHLIGDFYVLFDKHYKEECKQLQEQYEKEGMTAEEAKEKAEHEAPLIKEAHDMLVKWELTTQRFVLCGRDEQLGICWFRRDLQGVGRWFR